MGESYDGRAAGPSISREGVMQKSCWVTATQSIIKVTEQSVCFGRGGVTAFTESRVTGVLQTRYGGTWRKMMAGQTTKQYLSASQMRLDWT